MSSLTPSAASAPKPSLRAKPRPFGTGTPRARGPSARRPQSVIEVSARRPRTPIGLYVHIPFCAARCPYCDFATAPARTALRSRYMEALEVEIRREGLRLGRPRVATLYFGGGTPSLLEPGEVARLSTALRDAFDLRPVEATVEANPATLDRARLESWATLGITRLSLGAQSMSAAGLRALGRTHQPQDIAPAVAAARSVGFGVNLDLIFGWPGQTADAWREDLAAAVDRGGERIVDSAADVAVDTAMLALRLDDGLDLVRYGSRFGQDAAARVRTALRSLDGTRLLRWSGERVRLTARGRLLANEVFVRLLPDDTSVSTSV